MPQHMGRNGLVLQGGATLLRSLCMLGYEECKGVAAERSPGAGREQRVTGVTPAFLEPDAQHGDGLGGQGGTALLAPLAEALQVCPFLEVDIPATQPGELGDPKAGLQSDRQQDMVTATDPAGAVRSREQGVDL